MTTWSCAHGQCSEGEGSSFIEHMKYRINRMLSGQDETFSMRIILWKGGWQIFKDYPLTGCGFRCVDLVHPKYPDPTGHIKKIRGIHITILSNFQSTQAY